MNEKIKPYVQEDGRLAKYAWPGGYPMFYITKRGNGLCPNCASEELEDEADPPVGGEVNWENEDLYCEGCSGRIESAYAEESFNLRGKLIEMGCP